MSKLSVFIRLIFVLLVLSNCEKKYELPPLRSVNESAKINIASIKSRYNPSKAHRFSGDTCLYCVVTADEVSGNLYKEVYVKDHSGSIHINLLATGGLFIGDSIRINLSGIIINGYPESMQLDSVDLLKSAIKLASGLNPLPVDVNIPQLTSNVSGAELQSCLIRLNGVEFVPDNRNQPFANAVTKASCQYTLQDCEQNHIVVKTSGYCSFASQLTPSGNGRLTAIASRFNNTVQLILRNTNDLSMNAPNCITPTIAPQTTFLSKDFEDGLINTEGWNSVSATGNITWAVKTQTLSSGTARFAECNNYLSSGNQPACESWLISPPVNLAASTAPNFSFTSASLFTGPQLQTLVSDNYQAGAPSTATWTTLYPTYGLSGTPVSSGEIHLFSFKKTNVRVAFKYSGNNGSGQRWQIDNIRIWE